MAFIQMIEIVTTRREEIADLVKEWKRATGGRRQALRSTLTEDRERPGTYVQMVEFDSYEGAMSNSALPETTLFAEKLIALCDAPPVFRNLDVLRIESL